MNETQRKILKEALQSIQRGGELSRDQLLPLEPPVLQALPKTDRGLALEIVIDAINKKGVFEPENT